MGSLLDKAARWTWLLATTSAVWLGIAGLAWWAEPSHLPALERADFVIAAGEAIPPDSAEWHPVSLPDDWRNRPRGIREGWYRLRLDHDAGDPHSAIYLPVVSMNAAVHLNGKLVGSGGRFEEPMSRNWSRPLLFSLPPSFLQPGTNTLHVRVKADLDDKGLLGRVHVGRHRDLRTAHARAMFIEQTLVWVLVVARLVVAAFCAAIWVMWRQASYYGWFALSAVAWVGAELNILIADIPVPLAAWYWLLYVSIGWWGITAVRLIMSFLDVSSPRAETGLLVLGVSGSLALALLAALDSPYFHPIALNVWLPLAFVTSCFIFRTVLPVLRRHPDEIEFRVVFIVTLSIVGCVLWDLLMQVGVRPRGGLNVPVYGSVVALVGMGWVLLRRFVGALRESQALVATLEERVRDKRVALDESYHRIREVDRVRVLAEERERIMREMHDGIGSHLVSTLAMIEGDGAHREAIGPAVRAALEDLRMMVDSLETVEGDLLAALAMLRARLQPRLEAAGLRVEWQVVELPTLPNLGPEKILQVLRILQEMFTNVVRHAEARTLTVRTGEESAPEAAVFVEVADDGRGMTRGGPPGRGLGNMLRRAETIGAALAIESSASGTRVRLTIPAARPAAVASAERSE